ncbi:MAG: alpha/beta hydrolase [Candidatus Uhrbacteria bacterium]
MPNKVIIIHGWDGFPEEGWFPWLKNELESRGHEVIVPVMPNANEPRINKWIPAITEAVGQTDENTYFVGHSIGVQAIARFLQGLPEETQIGGAVFVAGYFKHLTNIEDDPIEKSVVKEWLETPTDLNAVKEHMKQSVAIFSESDPFVPLDNQYDFKDKLGSEIIILQGPGHFSGPSDNCMELPEVLDSLLRIMD